MGLNIKNEQVHRLVQELAAETGESQTTAVLNAVQERLDRLRRKDKGQAVERLLAIGAECAAHMKEPYLSIDHGQLLYGPDGLPK